MHARVQREAEEVGWPKTAYVNQWKLRRSAYRSQQPTSEATLNKQLGNKQAYTIDGENNNQPFLPKLLSAMRTQIS